MAHRFHQTPRRLGENTWTRQHKQPYPGRRTPEYTPCSQRGRIDCFLGKHSIFLSLMFWCEVLKCREEWHSCQVYYWDPSSQPRSSENVLQYNNSALFRALLHFSLLGKQANKTGHFLLSLCRFRCAEMPCVVNFRFVPLSTISEKASNTSQCLQADPSYCHPVISFC